MTTLSGLSFALRGGDHTTLIGGLGVPPKKIDLAQHVDLLLHGAAPSPKQPRA
jgi:hypothetical protein